MMRDSSSVKSPTVAFWVGQDDDDECDFVDTNEGMDLGDSERISLLPKGSGSGSLREQANHSPNVPLHKHVPSVLDLIASPTSHNNSTAASHLVATADSTLLEAPILQVMDRIEDEVEAHAYEDLVPLEIKLALEDRVFGWTHLTSAFLGHTLFTIGAYWLVNEIVRLCAFVIYGPNEPFWLQFVQVALSMWAGIGTYRMVRRRRRVWFRAAYGSKAYKQDKERRRKSVQETDRETTLGKMIQNWRHRRFLRRLRKAETRFAKKHEILRRQESPPTSPTSDSTRLLYSNASISSSGSSSSSDDDDDDEQEELYDTTSRSVSPAKLSSSRRPKRQRLTRPTHRMESYAHDQILFPTIKIMPYAHGGFFGAAPFLLTNPHWISILRHLMPDVYVEISRRVTYSPASKLIHWAENNPVIAAFGAAHEFEYHNAIPNLEWDVFLDPVLVGRVEAVLDEQEKFLSTNAVHGAKAKHILRYYQKELKQRAGALVDKMLIAHGNLTQLCLEQTGYLKSYNYSRVKRTRRTLGGGIYARQWMAVFAEALKLGMCHSELNGDANESNQRLHDEGNDTRLHGKSKMPSLMALAESNCPEMIMAESIRIVESITGGKNPIGLVLDVKSRHVPKRVWKIVVDTLREAGIRVEGIGSFSIEDIRGVSQLTSEPVKEITFFHSAGDLQRACREGRVQQGDTIFFNAGSLLWEPSGSEHSFKVNFDPQWIKDSYRVQPAALPGTENCTIQFYKEQYNLSIGVYCQEFAVDEAAVRVLSQHINRYPEIYDLGFSWGGVNGITIKSVAPGRFTVTDGFWNQRYLGDRWHYGVEPRVQEATK